MLEKIWNCSDIEIDEHKESVLIRNKQGYDKVKYSMFPPLTTDYDKDDEKPKLESTDRVDIRICENDLAKNENSEDS